MPGFSRFPLHSWETWGHFCGGWRTRSFEQWTSRITGHLHLMIILMVIPVNMNEFQTFPVVVFRGECDVVVVGFSVTLDDFGCLCFVQ